MKRLLLLAPLSLMSLASADSLHYLENIGYPILEDVDPHRIFVQAEPVKSDPIIQVTCSDGDGPQDVQVHNIDAPGSSNPIILQKDNHSTNITQSIRGRRFRFYATVTCQHLHSNPVLQFHDYQAGVYLLSECHGPEQDADLSYVSWSRAWGQIQHTAPLANGKNDVVARLKPRNVRIPNTVNDLKLWDTLEVTATQKIVNHLHLTLGCVVVEQSEGIILKLPTGDLDSSGNQVDTTANQGGTGTALDGFSDEELMPQLPLIPGVCVPKPIDGCPDQFVPCGYVFFPSQAYAGFNLGKYHGSDISVLAQYCSQQETQCLAFNSDGWYKRTVPPQAEWQAHGGPCEGTYVKESHVSEANNRI